jgi:signal transduction histidine kinase
VREEPSGPPSTAPDEIVLGPLDPPTLARVQQELLAVLAHELRTPLNAILGWTRLLQRPALDEAARAEGLAVVDRNAKVQARLLDEYLDLGRVLGGAVALDRAVHPAGDLVAAAVAAAGARGAAIDVRTGGGPVPSVAVDAARATQVLGRLLERALDRSPPGGRVAIEFASAGEAVEFAVADEGPVLSPAERAALSEPFGAADGPRPGRLEVALTVARQLTAALGGALTVGARPGGGARFVLRLPAGPR